MDNNKIKIIGGAIVVALLAGILYFVIQDDIPVLKNGEEAILSFDGEKISVDELFSKMKDDYEYETLMTLIKMMDVTVLEAEFEDFVTEADEYASTYINSMKDSYGSEEELLSAIQQGTGYQTVDAYKEYIYITYFQNHATEEYAKSLISEDQIEKYFEEEYEGDVTVSHILMTPAYESGATEEEMEEAKQELEEYMTENIIDVLNQAKKDGEDIEEVFAELVKEHSEDEATIEANGDLGKVNYWNLDRAYDELLDSAFKLKVGSYSTEIIETSIGYHVILKTDQDDKEELEDVKSDIHDLLAENLLLTDNTMLYDTLEYYREKHGMKIEDDELADQYKDYMTEYAKSLEEQLEQ